jgi:hypothetical protein
MYLFAIIADSRREGENGRRAEVTAGPITARNLPLNVQGTDGLDLIGF